MIKTKELKKMSKEEREGKLKELKMELLKSKINASKNKGSRTRDIRRIIARIITLNNQMHANQRFSEPQNQKNKILSKINRGLNKK